MKRKDTTAVPCPESCKAMCCNYIVKHLSPPRTKLDFDEIYWFLCHDKVSVFIDGRKWYLLVDVPCGKLDAKSRCRIYAKRPYVCRLHSEENCEYTGKVDFQEFMKKPGDLLKHMRRRGISFRLPWMEDKDKRPEHAAGRTSGKTKGPRKRGGKQP